jgi:glutaredoxin
LRLKDDSPPNAASATDMPRFQAAPEAAFMARYDAGRDRILMYSLSTCGYCAEKRRLFDRMGVRHTEYTIDEDQAAEDRLSSRLRESGMPINAVGTPIIEVNGTLLPNNPDLDEIATHLTRTIKG